MTDQWYKVQRNHACTGLQLQILDTIVHNSDISRCMCGKCAVNTLKYFYADLDQYLTSIPRVS